MAFIKLLPPDLAGHVLMHNDLPQYKSFDSLKSFTEKHVKVMLGLERQRKGQRQSQPLKLLEARLDDCEAAYVEGEIEEEEEDTPSVPCL